MNKMKGIKVLLIILTIFFGFSGVYAVSITYINAAKTVAPQALRLIAHAGGEIYGIRMTNSVQALDNSYSKEFRLFELDIDWTSDGVPVVIHDWGNVNWFMNIKYSTKPPTFEEFKNMDTILGLKLMDLDILEEWLLEHEDAYIVTDVKNDNLKMLGIIKKQYSRISSQIIPQIYSFEEYDSVKDLGYKNIILTKYKIKATDDEVIDFCQNHSLFGITMYEDIVNAAVLNKYSELGIPIYVHTINNYNEYVKLRDNGAYGVYTDYFQPSNWVE